MSHAGWWPGLPRWLKLVYLLGAVPAWLFLVFCALTGQNKSVPALVAFGVFMIATLLNIAFDRRRNVLAKRETGVDFGGNDA